MYELLLQSSNEKYVVVGKKGGWLKLTNLDSGGLDNLLLPYHYISVSTLSVSPASPPFTDTSS